MRKSTMRMIGLWLIPAAVAVAGWAGPLSAQVPGRIFRDCDVCPEMVVVPAGSFMMGSAGLGGGSALLGRATAPGNDRLPVRGWRVRSDVRGMGRVRSRGRLPRL